MKNNGELYDTIDLGLLTRVICHECNNLIASQQGYLNLLKQYPEAPELNQRWLQELARINDGLKVLMAGIQAHTPVEIFDDPSIYVLALRTMEEALALGASLPALALERTLAIILALEPVEIDSIKIENRGLDDLANSETDDPQSVVVIRFNRSQDPINVEAWQKAASERLPPEASSSTAWQRVLVLGLARQYGSRLTIEQDGIELILERGDDPRGTSR